MFAYDQYLHEAVQAEARMTIETKNQPLQVMLVSWKFDYLGKKEGSETKNMGQTNEGSISILGPFTSLFKPLKSRVGTFLTMPSLLAFLKAKWRQYGRYHTYFLAQTGPTRRVYGIDKPEVFLELLSHAVDYQAARKSLINRLNQCEQRLNEKKKVIDELSYRVKSFNTKKQEVPMLESVIRQVNGSLAENRAALEEYTEARDLFLRRLRQCKREQQAILRRLYSLTDLFLLAR